MSNSWSARVKYGISVTAGMGTGTGTSSVLQVVSGIRNCRIRTALNPIYDIHVDVYIGWILTRLGGDDASDDESSDDQLPYHRLQWRHQTGVDIHVSRTDAVSLSAAESVVTLRYVSPIQHEDKRRHYPLRPCAESTKRPLYISRSDITGVARNANWGLEGSPQFPSSPFLFRFRLFLPFFSTPYVFSFLLSFPLFSFPSLPLEVEPQKFS